MNWIRIIQWCVGVWVDMVRSVETLGGNRPRWHHDELCHSISAAVFLCCPLSSSPQQGNSRPDTLQRLSAPTQNNSSLCLLNKSWSLERKASTLVSGWPVFPNDYIFPVSSPSPPWHCTKHDLRSGSPPGPQCYQQSCWICSSLGRSVDRLQSPHVQSFLELN